jgi:uncharacterized damage-inducible protein DinB
VGDAAPVFRPQLAMTDPRYPIGKFAPPQESNRESRLRAIQAIADTPDQLRAAVQGLDEDQLDTPYRDGGWTLRQVVHHVPDSHLNAYVRLKLALTEPTPVIKPYDEAAWAMLVDNTAVPIDVSLNLLEALHTRWVALMRAMKDQDFERQWVHPDTGQHTLDRLVALYAWHGPHHVGHITSTRQRMGW